jgi:hypothetical protein
MKTTIKTHTLDVIVKPVSIIGYADCIELSLFESGPKGRGYVACIMLTEDQCGALIFGIEQALEARQIAALARAN